MVLDEVGLYSFCHTAQHAQYYFPSFLLFGVKSFQTVVNLVLCILSDAAGIEEDGIGLFFFLTHVVACHLHDAGYNFAVCHIHLAAISFDK